MDYSKRKNYRLVGIILVIFLVLLMILAVTIGIAKIKFMDTFNIILSHFPLFGKSVNLSNVSATNALIIWNLRVPRVILAALAGAGLSICGGVFQGMFRNPMADPYVLGISSGAACGATIAIISGASYGGQGVSIITFSAFLGAILTTLLVYLIARTNGRLPTTTLLLSGVAFSFLLSSAITLMMVFNRSVMDKIVYWSMGSFSGANWTRIYIVSVVVILGTAVVTMFSRDLNIMSTGDETATSLGINVERTKKILLVITSLIVGACVAVSGIIGFVGLIIPHITRLLFKPDHRILLPFSALFGAGFMVLADLLARNIMPWILNIATELPVGAITSCFGAPFFIWLLIRNKRRSM